MLWCRTSVKGMGHTLLRNIAHIHLGYFRSERNFILLSGSINFTELSWLTLELRIIESKARSDSDFRFPVSFLVFESIQPLGGRGS
jgi:hypothetical protein